MTENRKKYVIFSLVTAGVYLFMRFLSPVCSPFIFAFLFAGLLSKLTDRLPFKIKKPAFAGIILILALVLALFIIGLLGSLLVQKCGEMAGQITYYEDGLCKLLGNCCDFMESSFGIDGTAVENYVLRQVNIFVENLEVNIVPAVMNKSVLYLKNTAGVIGYVIVFIIAVFLILKDYDKVWKCIKGHAEFKGFWEITKKVVIYLKTYMKAQIILLLIIGSVCAVALGFIGIKGGILYGIITGFMDMLPFIGTGIMLLPLAFLQLVSENYWQAVIIVGLYAVCALTREFLEPKLIGNKVGIWPVGILFSVFAGIKLFGILGIIKGPVGLVIICETWKYLFGERESHAKEDS